MGLLIRNTLAVLPDGSGHAVGRHDLYIEGSCIAGIDEAPVGFTASETIDGTRLLTIPGLVNAHTHTYMAMMRNAADDALRMATRAGARALGLPCGSIEVGKKADLALLDLSVPSLTPLGNPVSALAYAVNGSEVDTVIIDGKAVLRHRELLTIDEERVRFEIARICERLGLNRV